MRNAKLWGRIAVVAALIWFAYSGWIGRHEAAELQRTLATISDQLERMQTDLGHVEDGTCHNSKIC